MVVEVLCTITLGVPWGGKSAFYSIQKERCYK